MLPSQFNQFQPRTMCLRWLNRMRYFWFAAIAMVAVLNARSSAQVSAPQFLPVTAEWCLSGSSQSYQKQPVCIALEVADDHNKRRIGLMRRPPLPPLQGMLFVFHNAFPISMWMLNTPASLDMLFILNNQVIAIEPQVPPCRAIPCPSYFADRDGDELPDVVDAVIELRSGETQRLGIQVNDSVEIRSVDERT